MTLRKCTGIGCQSIANITAALQSTIFSIAFLNSYMDFSDFNTPVKTYLDDRNAFYTSSTISKTIKLYARLNEVNLDDDYLSLKSPTHKEFFTLEKTVVDINAINSNPIIDATIFFRL